MADFKERFGIGDFRVSTLTWVSLIFLIVLYPLAGGILTEDPTAALKNLTEGFRIVLLVSTIIVQWLIFFLVWITTFREKTTLASIGLKKIQPVDFAWGLAFFAGANTIFVGLTWFLAQIGLPMPGEIALLIPEDAFGRVLWVMVSFTAGFCEETAFRGYLMTRLRLVGKFPRWLIPVVVSSVVFGACHAYQGLPGFILLLIYGLMIAILYIRTESLWPCIIAHSIQDLAALLYPQ